MTGRPEHQSDIRVVHSLRRRLRLQIPTLAREHERIYALEIILRKWPGIKRVRSVVTLGSVAIHFDPKITSREKIVAQIQAIVPRLGRAGVRPVKNRIEVGQDRKPVTANVSVEGMTCAACALLVELHLNRDPRVQQATVNYGSDTASITGRLDRKELYQLIESVGYTAAPMDTLAQRRMLLQREKQRLKSARFRALVAGLLTLPVMIIGMAMPRSWSLKLIELILTTPVMFWAGRPFFDKALKLARQRTANMDTLIALGSGSAYLYSTLALMARSHHLYFEAASGIVFFVLLGRYLEEYAKGKTSEAISRLIELQPTTASVIRDGEEVIVDIDQLLTGDLVRVRPGERIPVDGVVESGVTTVDESIVSGESMPVVKETGHSVIGGSINGQGSFQMRATEVGENTVLAGIIRMVDEVQSNKLPIQKMADRISSVFVPSVMATSVFTFLGWLLIRHNLTHALINAISVLLIACPCAFGLATPTAIMTGSGNAARRGIFIRNGESLETAAKLNTLIFDKTGTITEGKPMVTDFSNISRFSDQNLLSFVASVENHSEHFMGRAAEEFCLQQGARTLNVEDFHNHAGRGVSGRVSNRQVLVGNARFLQENGVETDKLTSLTDQYAAQGKTPVLIAIDARPCAIMGIADKPRVGAKEAISRLNTLGIETWMVTGDTNETAQHIARQVGITRVVASATPEQKLEIVNSLKNDGAILVGMIGDGINDAPALAAADTGFAVGTGTDVAIEASQITLASGDITKVADAIALSRKTMKIIRENLFWALGYNTVAIPVAMAGRLNPMIASAAMAASSVSVVANSLRLQRDPGNRLRKD